jgi:hypothetical protein
MAYTGLAWEEASKYIAKQRKKMGARYTHFGCVLIMPYVSSYCYMCPHTAICVPIHPSISPRNGRRWKPGAQSTCFTSTKVQILTPEARARCQQQQQQQQQQQHDAAAVAAFAPASQVCCSSISVAALALYLLHRLPLPPRSR